jgi:hypothetical protein
MLSPGLDFDGLVERDGDGGVPFVWPPVKPGHKVELTSMRPYPRGEGEPLVLETLAVSPKVFYVHNFLSDGEADKLVAFAQVHHEGHSNTREHPNIS